MTEEERSLNGEAEWLAANLKTIREMIKSGVLYGQKMNAEALKIAQLAESEHHKRLIQLQNMGIKPQVLINDK